ncbi:cyclic nucleotide-binding domain-containing protein [Rhizobium sp. SIMBA_035]
MFLRDEVEMLRRVPIFSTIEPAKLKLLAFASDRRHYRAGTALCHQGDHGDAAFVVLTGTAEVLVHSPNGDVKVADVTSNSIVGEISILCDTLRTATVRASTDVEALRISKEQFLKLITDTPRIAVGVMRVLADRLAKSTSNLTELRSRGSEVS